jgi:hypothetical protein
MIDRAPHARERRHDGSRTGGRDMATALTNDAKHRGCRIDASYPFAGERPLDAPPATPEHPLRVLADVRRA